MVYSGQKIASIFRIVFLLNVSLFISCKQEESQSLPYYNTPDFEPIFISSKEEVPQQIPHQIAEFSLRDQHNRPVTQKNIEGRIHVANFIFTSCASICPKMTNHMKRISEAFPNDDNVILLSYSVTPWIDNVERLNAYAIDNDITSANWHLLTGDKASIYQLARRSYFAEEDIGFTRDSSEFLHTEHFLLVDATKRIRGIYNGTLQLEIEQLIGDIRELKKESALRGN
jgi:protein SCO1